MMASIYEEHKIDRFFYWWFHNLSILQVMKCFKIVVHEQMKKK